MSYIIYQCFDIPLQFYKDTLETSEEKQRSPSPPKLERSVSPTEMKEATEEAKDEGKEEEKMDTTEPSGMLIDTGVSKASYNQLFSKVHAIRLNDPISNYRI